MSFRLLSAIFLLTVFANGVSSQGLVSILDQSTNPGAVLMEFDNRRSGTIGTYYVDENWNTGEIHFRSGTVVKGFPVRYDLQYDILEIKVADQVKVLPIRKMEGFQYYDEESGSLKEFVPCSKLKYEDGTPLTGICRKFEQGEFGLYSRYDFVVKDPDYVVALDMGTEDKHIYIKERPLLLVKNAIYPIPSRKMRIYTMFGDRAERAREFAEREKLNVKRTSNLKILVDFINAEPVQ